MIWPWPFILQLPLEYLSKYHKESLKVFRLFYCNLKLSQLAIIDLKIIIMTSTSALPVKHPYTGYPTTIAPLINLFTTGKKITLKCPTFFTGFYLILRLI